MSIKPTNRKRDHSLKTAEEEEEDVGPRGTKRKRTDRPFRKRKAAAFEETAEEEGEDIVFGEVVGPSEPKTKKRTAKKRKSVRKRKPSLKAKLLKDLRAKRRKRKAELAQLNRDINSLICKRRKTE